MRPAMLAARDKGSIQTQEVDYGKVLEEVCGSMQLTGKLTTEAELTGAGLTRAGLKAGAEPKI